MFVYLIHVYVYAWSQYMNIYTYVYIYICVCTCMKPNLADDEQTDRPLSIDPEGSRPPAFVCPLAT